VLSQFGWLVAAIATIALILCAVWVAGEVEHQLKTKDPGCIVIDEVAGMMVTLLGLPVTMTTAVAGFFLFRLFDIIKPPPARQLDRHLGGGWGIVMDDIAAGIMANIVLRLGLYWMNHA
jgi:phosphatidylglycerophosphatase A